MNRPHEAAQAVPSMTRTLIIITAIAIGLFIGAAVFLVLEP